MVHSRRVYRDDMRPEGFITFECKVKETDLHIAVDAESYTPELAEYTERRVLYYRNQLESYIARDPLFKHTLEPHIVELPAPGIVLAMVRAGNAAGVGPMAAVAGAVAEFVAADLLKTVKQVIVENGGDIFMKLDSPGHVLVYAGNSPFSNRISLEVRPGAAGICTSSGTVGPSLSFGKADAAVILSPSAALSDAVATAAANRIQSPEDLPAALDFVKSVPGMEGALLILDDKLTAWGGVKILPAGSRKAM